MSMCMDCEADTELVLCQNCVDGARQMMLDKCQHLLDHVEAFNNAANIAQRRQMELEKAFDALAKVVVCPSCGKRALTCLCGYCQGWFSALKDPGGVRP